MTRTSTCHCGAEISDDRYACPTCTAKLDVALGDCSWLDDELDTTITRQRSATIGASSTSADHGIPWHERGSDAKRNLHGLLSTWVRFAAEEGVKGAPATMPRDTIPSMARWLLHVTHGLALHDTGPDAIDEITDAVAECQRIVFWKRKARVYLGTCEQTVTDDEDQVLIESCPGEVYADEEEAVGHCDECGQGVTVVIRKAEIDKRLEDRLCSPADIAGYAVLLGLHAPRESVRKRVNYWHRHKRIEQKSTALNGDPLFRYGEVRSRLYAEFGRESA